MQSRNWLRFLITASCVTLTLVAQDPGSAQGQQPQDPSNRPSYKVGDTVKTPAHRSKWEYPKEFQVPEGTGVHWVAPGDTLWDLGSKFLGNPYAWPQIWELNKWIKDPHWIFPGDPLLIPTQAKALAKATDSPQNLAPSAVADLQPDRSSKGFARAVPTEMAFSRQDFLQAPYLASEGQAAHFKANQALRISGAENSDRRNFGDGEKIYLEGGRDRGVKEGERRVIVKVLKAGFFHPDDKRRKTPLGDILQQIGIAQVLHVTSNGAVAVIERALDGVAIGDHLLTFEEPAAIPLKLRTDKALALEVTQPAAKIIFIKDGHQVVGAGELVIIDKGSKDGFKVGDVLLSTIEESWPLGTPKDGAKSSINRYGGQLIVFKTEPNSSTCRILRSVEAMGIGTIAFK